MDTVKGPAHDLELDTLYQISTSINSHLELDEVLREIMRLVHEVTQGDSCLLYLIDEMKQDLVLQASKDPHPGEIGSIRLKLGEGITGWVAQHQEAVAIGQHSYDDSRFKFFADLPEDRFEAFLSAPVMAKNKVIGVINVQHREARSHTGSEIKLLTIIGQQVGNAIENARVATEALEAQEALETRKVLERAKGILQADARINEEQAYLRIQQQSRRMRKPMKEIAEAIILAFELKKPVN